MRFCQNAGPQCLLILVITGCDILPRPGDTQGVQQAGRWEQHGRIIVQPDSRYTVVYLRVDTTVAPLRPDSVRGTYTMQTRGMRQLAGRIDATLYFTAWDDPTKHATYRLRQRIHGVRP